MLQVQYKFRLKCFRLILKIPCHLSSHSRIIRARRQRNLILINPTLKKINNKKIIINMDLTQSPSHN